MGYVTPGWFAVFTLSSEAVLILKILGTTAFPQQLLSLEMAAANRGFAKFAFPSLAQQSRQTPLQVQCPNALKPTPPEASSRNETGVRSTNLDMRKTQSVGGPAKMLSRIIKRDKRLVDLSATRNRVHTRVHAQA